MGVGETRQIIGETGVGETGVGEMGVIPIVTISNTIVAIGTNFTISWRVANKALICAFVFAC